MKEHMLKAVLTLEQQDVLRKMLPMCITMTQEMVADYGDLPGHKDEVREAREQIRYMQQIMTLLS